MKKMVCAVLLLVFNASAFAFDARNPVGPRPPAGASPMTSAATEPLPANAPATADEQQPPQPAPATVASGDAAAETPSPAVLQSRLDSFGEAFTEMKNVVDALSKLKVTGYVQAQYVHDERSANALTGTAATRNLDQFSIRRGRVKFTYQFAPTSKFVIQPDITTNGVVLKDGYLDLTEPWTSWKHTLTAGQFNWPFGFEIGYSSSTRELPERSLVIRTLFPGERDRGVQLSGLGLGERFSYKVALVNGTGTTQSFDFNKRKDVVGRIGASFGRLDVGTSLYRGAELVSLAGNTAGREFEKNRQGIDFQLVTPIEGLGVRGEYITGTQPPAAGAPAATAAPADVRGWYVYAIQSIGTRHQVALRVDAYDPNSDIDGNATRTIGGSYIFHWDANSKVMVAYEKPKRQTVDPEDDVFTLRYQFSF